jgi:hypothetical protein
VVVVVDQVVLTLQLVQVAQEWLLFQYQHQIIQELQQEAQL